MTKDEESLARLKAIVAALPSSPGCYQYLDRDGRIIYVGKAKNLNSRVSSYFHKTVDRRKTEVLVSKIEDRDGKVIYEAPTVARQAIPTRSAFLVQQLLKGGMSGTSSRLMGFVGYDKAADTDFGGKTGTSNNHSDAWFVGTTPRLVVGAWVGGEYRSIHFRTGMLGQGNRTALPICGYFLASVLNDPAFKQYRTRFTPPRDNDLLSDLYDCGGYFQAPADSDSIGIDSLDFEGIDEYIEYDEYGNPLQKPVEPQEPDDANQEPLEMPDGEATDPSEKQ